LLFLSLPLIFEYGCFIGQCCIMNLWTGLGFLSRLILTCCEGTLPFISRHIYGILLNLIIAYILSASILHFVKTKQNIVNFIKPTKRKLILALLIFLISPIWGLGLTPLTSIHYCPTYLTISQPEIGFIVLGEIIFSPITHSYDYIENLISPLQLFILYLISCTIIYYYNKLRK